MIQAAVKTGKPASQPFYASGRPAAFRIGAQGREKNDREGCGYAILQTVTGQVSSFSAMSRCPEELIGIYDLKLAAFFSRKNEVNDAARNIIELFMDNHGNINNNKE